MESKICMNASCRKTSTQEWKKGWPLRSGGFADLCYNCGSAYENSVFCDMFHKGETGWRDCSICGKSVHCGCVVSMYAFEHLDFGGIGCVSCTKNSQLLPSIQPSQIRNEFGTLNLSSVHTFSSIPVGNIMVMNVANKGELAQLYKVAENEGASLLSQSQGVEMHASSRKLNGERPHASSRKVNGERQPSEEVRKILLNTNQQSGVSSDYAEMMNDTPRTGFKEMPESLPQPSLSISLGASSRTPNFLPSSPDIKSEVKVFSSVNQGQRSRLFLPKPKKSGSSMNSEANKSRASQIPIARPLTDRQGKTLLLPRYWPRISDQELQEISGNLNSAIVPLFEKVLSASDAGRIGRLVLPKACAEAYFPYISQSEGIPLTIQDIKGKEWTFQFRFWPNNNSRMYVLEGVTPCIQSMQLQAGDTVIFSRTDPGGKLVIGFRKASNSSDTQEQDSQTPDIPNGNRDPHPKAQLEHSYSADGNIKHNTENKGKRSINESQLQPVMNSEKKKKTRNIGSKSKRLLMHIEDALELRLTWEEAQDLLRPPPSVNPSIFIIEDLEFEEYDEPPIFGKRTVFTSGESGEQDQWAQCDDCSKWRRLPVDVLLPSKWTCSDNAWDPSRCSCSATDELNPNELYRLFRMCKDFKKRKCIDSNNLDQDCEPSGLDALATAAVLGDSMGEQGEAYETSTGVTTKHPRHRPGCSCIVCVQPPSGKGKHRSTCTCNVCMTVKRRFKTLMLRKKKCQSECEANTQQKNHKDEDVSEKNVTSKHSSLNYSENEESNKQRRHGPEAMGCSNGIIDLNCDPEREDMQLEETGLSTISLVQAASLPLENHVIQNGSTSLNNGEQDNIIPCTNANQWRM